MRRTLLSRIYVLPQLLTHDGLMFGRYVSRDRNIVQFYGACVQENNLLLVAEMMEVRTCRLQLAVKGKVPVLIVRSSVNLSTTMYIQSHQWYLGNSIWSPIVCKMYV